ncbi:MAG: hypothetical protein HYR67_08270 [Bacteroidetes bacterium]|nr:hypothetical protein [Bacteroidota bacterium]
MRHNGRVNILFVFRIIKFKNVTFIVIVIARVF